MLEGFDGGECGERMCGTCGAGHTHGGGAAGETGTGDAVTGVNIGAAEMFFAFGLEFGEREINLRRILHSDSEREKWC